MQTGTLETRDEVIIDLKSEIKLLYDQISDTKEEETKFMERERLR